MEESHSNKPHRVPPLEPSESATPSGVGFHRETTPYTILAARLHLLAALGCAQIRWGRRTSPRSPRTPIREHEGLWLLSFYGVVNYLCVVGPHGKYSSATGQISLPDPESFLDYETFTTKRHGGIDRDDRLTDCRSADEEERD